MKRILTLLALMIVCLGLNAQTMHTLIFVNTQEKYYGDRTVDRTADYNNMKAFFSDIAAAIGYTNNMRAHKLQQDFNSAMVNREIENLNVKKNDIVVFYYSGHGANSGNDVWPTLTFDAYGRDSYWQTEILRKLRIKCTDGNLFKPKLLICIADCCNNVHDGNIRGTFDPENNASGIKKLFTGFPGRLTITMSASMKGQLSVSDLSSGSLFGFSLRRAIKDGTRYGSPTWESILESAKQETAKLAAQRNNIETGKPYYQVPQYSIKISGDPFDD